MATQYYFPNYPYNDLEEDPFLLEDNNAYNAECRTYTITATGDATYQYTDCFTNSEERDQILVGQTIEVCSITIPILTPSSAGIVTGISFDVWKLSVKKPVFGTRFVHFGYKDVDNQDQSVFIQVGAFTKASKTSRTVQVKSGTTPFVIHANTDKYTISKISEDPDFQNNTSCYPNRLNAFNTEDSKYRHVFNSPETSFGQPFLGDVLKIEGIFFGAGKGHFVQVKNNSLYKLLTKEAQEDALLSSEQIADSSGSFDSAAMFTAYQSYLQIYLDGITRKNYGWSYNSVASYDYYSEVKNGLGVKQRQLEDVQYLLPVVQSVGDATNINNYQRENSVYLKTVETKSALPFPHQSPSLLFGSQSLVQDRSRFINSDIDCSSPEELFDLSVVSYYGSIKNIVPNQWGQIYSYETIDTGFQVMFDDQAFLKGTSNIATIFGGDTFINKFAFKTKLPFFIDNRVNAPDDSDIFYDEIGNVAYPEYWHSARSILYDYTAEVPDLDVIMKNAISIKAHYFDCPNNQLPKDDNPGRTVYDGKMYMFAYGIPNFYCESSVNVDLRQAFNDREGDFYPRMSTGIPDDWLQETKVPIAQDNSYFYNITYSKQNKENFFSHLPVDWEEKLCFTFFPFRGIYSEPQQDVTDNRVNNWLIYRPISYFDFPQNYGKLTSLDGIQNKAILARFENKSLLYNTLLTINTSNPQAAYLGTDSLFTGAPPIDFAETDLGYVGSQHKLLLKIPQGQVTVDAKRGSIFLISGNQAKDLASLEFGLSSFLSEHLPFEITKFFPDVDIDNHFNGVGLHGVYDSEYNRIIISKLDYSPLSSDVKYDSELQEFYIENVYPQVDTTTTTTTGEPGTTTTTTTLSSLVTRQRIYITDVTYFCNKSWTLSFNFNTNSWISFHSYIPNWYVAENNFFYSGLNEGCDLEILAIEEVIATTTTTSSTENPFDCELEGIIENTTTTTSTTTETPTTTTTTTEEPTTTTTTTTELQETTVNISHNPGTTGLVAIVDLTVSDGKTFTPVLGSFPLTEGQDMEGTINSSGIFLDLTLDIDANSSGDKITITDSNSNSSCQDVTVSGLYVFPNIFCSNSTDVTIVAQNGTC